MKATVSFGSERDEEVSDRQSDQHAEPKFRSGRLIVNLGRIGHVGKNAFAADLQLLMLTHQAACSDDLRRGQLFGRADLDRIGRVVSVS